MTLLKLLKDTDVQSWVKGGEPDILPIKVTSFPSFEHGGIKKNHITPTAATATLVAS